MATISTLASIENCGALTGLHRVVWIILPPMIVALWGFLLVVVWRRTDPAGRPWLAAIFLVGLATNFFYFVPHARGGQEHLHRFLLVLVVAAIAGFVIGLFSRAVGVFRGGWFALAGYVVLLPGLYLLFVWLVAISGNCTPEFGMTGMPVGHLVAASETA